MATAIDSRKEELQNQARDWMKNQSDTQLVQTLKEQREAIRDLEVIHKEELQPHSVWVDMLQGELLRRMAESAMDSMVLDGIGRITRVKSTVYSVSDPDAILHLIHSTGNISIFNAKLKTSEVQQLIEQQGDGKLPQGITSNSVYSLRFTPSKDA